MSEETSDWKPPSVEECVAMLKSGEEGVEKWNKMRKEHPYWRPDLRNQDFSNAEIYDANLCAVNLSHANFKGALLNETDFSEADLSGANFREADIGGADFRDANLRVAIFTNAITSGANFYCADIAYAVGLKPSTVELVLATIRDSLF